VFPVFKRAATLEKRCFDARLLSHWGGWRQIEHDSDKTGGILGTQIVHHKTYGNLGLSNESPLHGYSTACVGGSLPHY
jgi:hypothetical protein